MVVYQVGMFNKCLKFYETIKYKIEEIPPQEPLFKSWQYERHNDEKILVVNFKPLIMKAYMPFSFHLFTSLSQKSILAFNLIHPLHQLKSSMT